MKKGTVAVSVISIAAFCVLAYLVTGSYTQRFDDAFRDMVYALRTSVLTFAAKGFSYAGDIQGVGAACIIFLIVPVTRKKLGIPVAAVVVVTQCAKKVIKMLIARPRPPLTDRFVFEDGFSFPSGHSITSMAICILAVYFIQTEMKSRAAAKVLSIFYYLVRHRHRCKQDLSGCSLPDRRSRRMVAFVCSRICSDRSYTAYKT